MSAVWEVESRHAEDGQRARIGPNAIIQFADALGRLEHSVDRETIFMRAGLGRYLTHPPESMVKEEEVIRLHTKARAILSGPDYTEVAQLAGRLTGDYVVANRIPRAACVVLSCLPGVLASRLLMRAIARHAWTFVGSGAFTYRSVPMSCSAINHWPDRDIKRSIMQIEICDSPLAREVVASEPCCHYYAASFERILVRLVWPSATVTEVACRATGDACCRFAITPNG